MQLQVFSGIIQYFYRKNGLQSKLIEVQQHLYQEVEFVFLYIMGFQENNVFFFFSLWNIWVCDSLLFLKHFSYFHGTENPENFYTLKKYINMLHYRHWVKNKNSSWASEYLGKL
jgi:hypothetical protein